VVEFPAELDGNPVDLEARILGIPGTDQLVAIARDISDRKAAERHFQELIDAKNKFIASVSHELRTPLTAVVGFAKLLHDPGDDLTEAERGQMIQAIAEQGSDLADLIEDLLVSARAEFGQLTITQVPVTLHAQTAQVIENMLPEDRKLTVEGGLARADPTRVRQILRNLITNALRYGGPELRVQIQQTPETAVLRVLDNGAGIPESEWEDIFQPYHRLNQPTTQTESVGIGLSVARQLAHLMAGDLTYQHRNGWSIFQLTLPTWQQPHNPTA
jgi:signal transduction histidine kinase